MMLVGVRSSFPAVAGKPTRPLDEAPVTENCYTLLANSTVTHHKPERENSEASKQLSAPGMNV